MCTAYCEGFYGTPSAQILMCTATKIYVYIRSTHPYLLHWNQNNFSLALELLLTNICCLTHVNITLHWLC